MGNAISDAAIALIVAQEVSDKYTYERSYHRPTWPQGNSGVTIGIGYDCGYVTAQELNDDWDGIIPDAMIQALEDHAIGVRGHGASEVAAELHSVVDVSWDAAMKVFLNRDIPKWIERVQEALPNTDKLSPDSMGALVSLAYNRGCSFALQGERYAEMRSIKIDMTSGDLPDIPKQLRSMTRLWPNMRGLRDRRVAEAELFSKGLNRTQGVSK